MDMSCMEQYNPEPYWQKLSKEQEIAHRKLPQLTATGELPDKASPDHQNKVSSSVDQASTDIENKDYDVFCASCHGMNGDGKTPIGQSLKPPPRDFSDKKWQEERSDAHIKKVIKKGGAAVGLSPLMAPWENVLDDAKIEAIAKKIRSFKK